VHLLGEILQSLSGSAESLGSAGSVAGARARYAVNDWTVALVVLGIPMAFVSVVSVASLLRPGH
jgi:hypothetical protein